MKSTANQHKLVPDGDPCGATRRHAVCHATRTALSVTDPFLCSAAGSRTWNELPFSLRDTGLFLMTYLFSVALLWLDPGVDGLKRLRLTPKLFD